MIRSKIQDNKTEFQRKEPKTHLKSLHADHSPEHADDSEGWIFSYADLITILMMFFIIMLSISNVSPEKFNALREALKSETTSSAPEKTVMDTKHDTTDSASSTTIGDINLARLAQQAKSTGGDKTTQIITGARILLQSLDLNALQPQLEQIKEIAEVKQQLMAAKLISKGNETSEGLANTGDVTRIQIVLSAAGIFDSSTQKLKPGAREIIRSIHSRIRTAHPVPYLEIESHSMVSEQSSGRIRSESEAIVRSSLQSYEVYREFVQAGADPALVAIAGYGYAKPLMNERDQFGSKVDQADLQNERIVIRAIWRRPTEAIAQ